MTSTGRRLLLALCCAALGCARATVDTINADAASAVSPPYFDPTRRIPITDDPNACARSVIKPDRAPLELFILVDSSGSMADTTPGGQSKWEAVVAALQQFLRDPESTGIVAALQFFPQVEAAAPASCATDAVCGAYGPCVRARACEGTGAACETDADCGQNSCVLVGRCGTSGTLCLPSGSRCAGGELCVALAGTCAQRDRCDSGAYESREVEWSPLPGAAPTFSFSLTRRTPAGSTPTGPALAGACAAARARAQDDPGMARAVLLVTDGLPTTCAPTDITGVSAIAAAAASQSPAVRTFVVGVLADGEVAEASFNLSQLAQAGGSGQAFVVDANSELTTRLGTALGAIRALALPCSFTLPQPASGARDVDYNQVNLRLTAASGRRSTVPAVVSPDRCDPVRGGWYYDVAPDAGARPTRTELCAASCAALQADPASRIDLVVGCRTTFLE